MSRELRTSCFFIIFSLCCQGFFSLSLSRFISGESVSLICFCPNFGEVFQSLERFCVPVPGKKLKMSGEETEGSCNKSQDILKRSDKPIEMTCNRAGNQFNKVV